MKPIDLRILGEKRFCPTCHTQLLETDDECSYCKTEKELEQALIDEDLDDLVWGDEDITMGERL